MTLSNVELFKKYFASHRSAIENAYKDLLRFPTISSHPHARPVLEACATWIANRFLACGCTVEQWTGEGPPVVFATRRSLQENAPTVLIYNHYDVQPADPLDEWTSDPFEPRIENETVYARGAQDNKGQLMYVLCALEALCSLGELPCHLKFIAEGEEENGSAALTSLIASKREKLQADYTMVIDVGMRRPHAPAINLGTRGLVNLTVTVRGPNQDLHSGVEGGVAHNPLHALVAMLAALRAPDGAIAVPGFYDDVVMPTDEELTMLSQTFDEKAWEETFGQPPTGGELAFPPLIRNWLRPTVEINGIHGGYGGPGSKTVIPREAVAKISCRLVPHQDPLAIGNAVRSFLLSNTPRGSTAEICIHEGMGKATRTSPHSRGLKTLAKALEMVWGTTPEYILDGASIPIIPKLQEASGGELIVWGVGLPSDHIHAPNERFDFQRMERGFCTLCLALQLLAS